MKKSSLYDIFAEKWGNDIFVYSDPHFGDLDCYKLRFPGELEHCASKIDFVLSKDQMQIDNINRKCGRASTLIILGDVGNVECVKKLKAKYKVLIMGNHDGGASNYKRVIKKDFSEVSFEELMRVDRTHFKVDDNHLFDEVYEGPVQIGPKLILSHEPVDCNYALNIHGHMHSSCINDIYHLNVIGEMTDYEPMNLSKIIKNGYLKDIKDIHRHTIDHAIERKEEIVLTDPERDQFLLNLDQPMDQDYIDFLSELFKESE